MQIIIILTAYPTYIKRCCHSYCAQFSINSIIEINDFSLSKLLILDMIFQEDKTKRGKHQYPLSVITSNPLTLANSQAFLRQNCLDFFF